jgi:hypothetical protein
MPAPTSGQPWYEWQSALGPLLESTEAGLDALSADLSEVEETLAAVPLPNIEGALGQYEPLANVATTVRSRAYNWEAEIKAKLVDDEWSTVESKRAELEAMDAARDTLCYRDDRSRKHFCTMPRCDIEDQLPGWYETRQQFREEKYTEGMS